MNLLYGEVQNVTQGHLPDVGVADHKSADCDDRYMNMRAGNAIKAVVISMGFFVGPSYGSVRRL